MNLNELTLAPISAAMEVETDNADTFVPEKVCAKAIRYAVEDHKLVHLDFVGGCEGNLKAISKLVEGMDISEVIDKLSGITCGNKPTSCADQLCIALAGQQS